MRRVPAVAETQARLFNAVKAQGCGKRRKGLRLVDDALSRIVVYCRRLYVPEEDVSRYPNPELIPRDDATRMLRIHRKTATQVESEGVSTDCQKAL